MGKASWLTRSVALGGLGLAALLPAGCGFVPKSRLDECHKMSLTLRAENAKLKDQTVSLRSTNQERELRAVDDARQIQEKDEAIEQLEQSVMAYQKERDQLASSYERLKSQVDALKDQIRVSQATPAPTPARGPGRDDAVRRAGFEPTPEGPAPPGGPTPPAPGSAAPSGP